MRRILITLMVATIALASGPLAVLAQTESGQAPPKPEELRQRLQQEKEAAKAALTQERMARIEQRCGMIKDRLKQIADRVATLKDKRANLYANINRILNGIVDKLKDKDVDTSKLEEDIATLNTKADEAKALWDDYASALSSLAEMRCDKDTDVTAFHDALEAAKQARIDLKAKVTEIKDFIKDVIKADLQAIREELKNKRTNDAGNQGADGGGTSNESSN